MVALFSITVFTSAFLLFLIQPLFTKMVLPLLGGAPAVWSTAMLFFQTALLLGYLYVHGLTRVARAPAQGVLHLVVVLLAGLALPLAVSEGWTPPTEGTPIFWMIGLMAVSVGLPFFALSATAPLLQRWYSYSGRPDAHNPYFLYSASNLGSIVALLGYPFLLERVLDLDAQGDIWSGGYGVLLLLLVGAVAVVVTFRGRDAGKAEAGRAEAESAAETISWGRRAKWIALAFVPSSLMLGVTQHIATDIASVPLLWVIPLTLYLLSFVLVFARNPWPNHRFWVILQPFVLLPLLLLRSLADSRIGLQLPLHFGLFFVTAMVCHGELARSRPGPGRLTEFYLWLSVGGALGGVFNALLSPVLFSAVIEYPLILALAMALRPGPWDLTRRVVLVDLGFVAAILVFRLLPQWLDFIWQDLNQLTQVMYFVIMTILIARCVHRPLRLALATAVILLAGHFTGSDTRDLIHRERSFFGVHEVYRDEGGRFLRLIHGRTIHGQQSLDPDRRCEPLGYYTREGPLGQVFAALDAQSGGARVAALGLGTGATATYAREGREITFYEIDPAVERLARDPTLFTYLEGCGRGAKVIIGDGRLRLAEAPSGSYDMIVVDVFSSDSIPAHLMTREAMAMYLDRLSPDGVLMIHVSNRYLQLKPVVAALARDAGAHMLLQDHFPGEGAKARGHFSSIWTLITKRPVREVLPALGDDWTEATEIADRPWTDGFSNVVETIMWTRE